MQASGPFQSIKETQEAIDLIVDPSGSSTAHDLLQKYRLTRPPSKDEIFADIEQELLLPPSKLPDHWLPTYQM